MLENDQNSGQLDQKTETIASVCQEKAALRSRMLRLRNGLSPAIRSEKSQKIRSSILSLCHEYAPGPIHLFLPFGTEPEIRPLLEPLWRRGFQLVVPVVSPGGLILAPLEPWTVLFPGPFGILEPKGFDPVPEDRIALYLLPGVAFDRNGGRLGYGKGYYDRLLIRCTTPKFGVSYDEQIVSSVPILETDILVDGIITDKEIVYRDRL
ncbi:MAG: 5-formyltetrahydrofolate cyclo-ligase [Leptospirales bacterium]